MVAATYSRILGKWPLATKSISSGILFGLGDGCAQYIQRVDDKEIDIRRLLAFSSYGLCVHAPTQHLWFAWLEKNVAAGASWSAKPMQQALCRVFAQTIFYAPASIAGVFGWMGLFASNRSAQEVLPLIAPPVVFPVWATGTVFWVPYMVFIFRYISLQSRVVATSIGNILWSTFLSYKSSLQNSDKDLLISNEVCHEAVGSGDKTLSA